MRQCILVFIGFLLGGCALRPAGEDEERDRSLEAGRPYEETREVPVLTEKSGPEDYLQIAFLRNAELEVRYWEWRAAIEEIPQASSGPNLAFSYGYMLKPDNMKSWDRTTLGLGLDPMAGLPFPTKLSTAGRRALEEARAAGHRFEEAKFLLQGRVLSAYLDLALLAESLRLQSGVVELLRQQAARMESQVGLGSADLRELLRVRTEEQLAENERRNLEGGVAPLVARINALLNRPATESVPLPAALPVARSLPVPDAELLQLGAEQSPGLSALARQVAGREEALDLARQAYLPDFNFSYAITGDVTRMAEGMLTLPFRLEAIRAGIEQAEAGLRAARAARVQYERDLAASFVLNLFVLRNSERQVRLFEETFLPRLQQTVDLALTSYAAGRGNFSDILDSERARLEALRTVAELRTEREKALAAIETWTAVDVEVMTSMRPALRVPGVTMRATPAGSSPPEEKMGDGMK